MKFHLNITKNNLRLAIVILFLLALGVSSWASSNLFSQEGYAVRWHPRRSPANARFVGDQACAECHGKLVAVQSHSPMGMAMEPVASSRVLTENPVMRFRSGPYSYEIKRKDKESFYTVTDGK